MSQTVICFCTRAHAKVPPTYTPTLLFLNILPLTWLAGIFCGGGQDQDMVQDQNQDQEASKAVASNELWWRSVK